MIFIAIEIAIEIGIDSVFRRFVVAISAYATSIPIWIKIKIMIMIKIKNNPQPTTYNPLLGGITEVTFHLPTFWCRLRRIGE